MEGRERGSSQPRGGRGRGGGGGGVEQIDVDEEGSGRLGGVSIMGAPHTLTYAPSSIAAARVSEFSDLFQTQLQLHIRMYLQWSLSIAIIVDTTGPRKCVL